MKPPEILPENHYRQTLVDVVSYDAMAESFGIIIHRLHIDPAKSVSQNGSLDLSSMAKIAKFDINNPIELVGQRLGTTDRPLQ